MSKVKISNITFDLYPDTIIVTFDIKIQNGPNALINMHYTREKGIVFKVLKKHPLDVLERSISVLRGYIRDKRHYEKIIHEIKDATENIGVGGEANNKLWRIVEEFSRSLALMMKINVTE